MLKNHKKTLILSSILTLLPMAAGLLLQGRLSQADGFGSLPVRIPCIVGAVLTRNKN